MGKLHASNGYVNYFGNGFTGFVCLHWSDPQICLCMSNARAQNSVSSNCMPVSSFCVMYVHECHPRFLIPPYNFLPSILLLPPLPSAPLPPLPSLLSLLPSLPCNRHYMCTRGVYLPHVRRLRATALQVRQWGWLSRWLRRGQLQWVWCIHMYIHTIYVHCWCPEVLYISAFGHSTVGDLWSSFWNPLAEGFDCRPKWFVSWLLPSSAGEAIQVMPPSWTHFRRGACQWWSPYDTATCLQQLTLDQ